MRIEDLLTDRQLIDYVKEYPAEPGGLEGLFPTRVVDDFEADFIMGAYSQPVMAELYAFDTPTELGQREAYGQGTLSLYLIKEKMKLDEREIMRLARPRSDFEQQEAIRRIFNDVDAIKNRIEQRIEWMRYQVLQTGKFEYKGNGITTSIDFGIPTDHKGDFTWSNDTADILQDISDTCDKIQLDTGFRPEHMIMSRKWLMQIVKNKTIRSALLGTEAAKLITPIELNQELARLGLPTISIDEKQYATQKVVTDKKGNARLQKEYHKFLDPDTVIFLPSGIMGETIRGLTPEGEGLSSNGGITVETAGQTVITHYKDVDPVAHYVKGSATAMVTFPYAEQVFIGKMK